jgi:hypothetical protein
VPVGDETEIGSVAGNRNNAYSYSILSLVKKHWQSFKVKVLTQNHLKKKMAEEQKGEYSSPAAAAF